MRYGRRPLDIHPFDWLMWRVKMRPTGPIRICSVCLNDRKRQDWARQRESRR